MASYLSGAQYLSEDRRARWLIENSPLKLQIARRWPLVGVRGSGLMFARENSALAPTPVASACNPVDEVADEASSITCPILDFITRYQVCFRDMDDYEHPNDLDQVLYVLALRRLIYGYFAMLDSPVAGGGLLDYVAATNKVTMAGGALTLDCLDYGYNLVTANEGRPTVIMSSSRGLRAYQKLCRDKGYDAPKMPWSWYNPATARMETGKVTEFNGTPWLINGLMAGESSTTASDQRIWFLVLGNDGAAGPTRGVTGIVPQARLRNMFIRREANGVVPSQKIIGVAEVPASILVETPTSPVRDVWVSFPAGLAVGSQSALSLVHNFSVPADCSIG